MNAPALDSTGYQARFAMLRALFDDLLEQLVGDGLHPQEEPVGEAFVRSAEEPGRAWNMVEWNAGHQQRMERR